jgi:uncharacterized protein
MFASLVKTGVLSISLLAGTALAAVALADAEPSAHDIYAAESSGHTEQARDMIDKVLAAHPNNAKAHFISAELYSHQNDFAAARRELQAAETLQPGLSFAKPESVAALKAQLRSSQHSIAPQSYANTKQSSSFPWMTMLLVGGIVLVVVLMFRRRAMNNYSAANPTYGAGSYTGSMPMNGPQPYGGVGATIMGGLAGGLAVGAGVVAGEELMRHMLHSSDAQASTMPLDTLQETNNINSDMGGGDFGLTDNSSDWGSGGSFSGDSSGGGDWG